MLIILDFLIQLGQVSVDFHSNVIKFGMAEPKSSNTLAVFDTSLKDYSIITIEPRDMDGIKTPYNLLPAAVPNFDYDLRIKNLTGNSIKVSALYKHLQILYDLATSDLEGFNEDLIEQIRHGLREGGPLANNRGYLRVPVDESAGYAPGQMVVLEIWPAGRQSSIHCHGFANAVIKVLHGSIDVELFDPLFHGCSDPIARETFTKGDVTWITPFHNQTHRLRNTTNDVAITVQCYEHSEALVPNPLEVFHYIGSESSIEEFRPTADFNGIPGLKAVLSPSSSSTPDLITPPATPSSRSRLSPQSSRTTSSNTRVVSTPHCSREGCKNPKFDGKDYCSRICEAFA
ncbi:hypothetical protein BCR33DRAFT_713726 [Rhizoclosmatium globosum]|uniref:Cysteine dioxygenase n=1 Tax=Rhizoclosmatium globosum TaxID=329046 RepID=A0A1Y2CR07_9FUNG|nr:hypothetical protein BCR33DRAFT_713726 [Rhizoclosmatium globosum]|eukprot:ORY49376.1 hypothetical protein BCR33DRAFT_713726 [Rhizoclosmatium globosum]